MVTVSKMPMPNVRPLKTPNVLSLTCLSSFITSAPTICRKKLEREFRDAATSRSTNEIGTFVNMFGKTKDLWFTKLATSVEEHNRMTD